jgi:hypothetical protein
MIQIYYNINTVWLSQVKSFLSSPPSKKSWYFLESVIADMQS